ncbi:hypothetical protein [Bradyrhizobium sp.]|uniref:hypothetical protein n=1 Tax=Bradyrhizobium sp. TaxID=376 RepID=UPI0012E7D235|nr:hypothetical protein [Bradyrhizobium sp.]
MNDEAARCRLMEKAVFMNETKLVAICNRRRHVVDEIFGVTDLIEAAKTVDRNCGADSLLPRYEIVDFDALREDRDDGYFFYSVPADFDIEDGSDPSHARGAEFVGTVKAFYQL